MRSSTDKMDRNEVDRIQWRDLFAVNRTTTANSLLQWKQWNWTWSCPYFSFPWLYVLPEEIPWTDSISYIPVPVVLSSMNPELAWTLIENLRLTCCFIPRENSPFRIFDVVFRETLNTQLYFDKTWSHVKVAFENCRKSAFIFTNQFQFNSPIHRDLGYLENR